MIDLNVVRQYLVQSVTCPLARIRIARLRSPHKPSCEIVRERVQTANARLLSLAAIAFPTSRFLVAVSFYVVAVTALSSLVVFGHSSRSSSFFGCLRCVGPRTVVFVAVVVTSLRSVFRLGSAAAVAVVCAVSVDPTRFMSAVPVVAYVEPRPSNRTDAGIGALLPSGEALTSVIDTCAERPLRLSARIGLVRLTPTRSRIGRPSCVSLILACPPSSVSATWSMFLRVAASSSSCRRCGARGLRLFVCVAWLARSDASRSLPLSAVPARSLLADYRLSSTPQLPVTIVFAVRMVIVIGRDPRSSRKPIRKNEQTGPRTLCNARSAGVSSVRVVTSLRRSYSALLVMLGVVRRGSRVVVVVFACLTGVAALRVVRVGTRGPGVWMSSPTVVALT